jgi:hypothetical protein
MKLYNVTFTNPFFADSPCAETMPLGEGKSVVLSKNQICEILDKYDLGYYSNFMSSGDADSWIDERGAWSQQVNGWFIVVETLGEAA